MKYAIISDIHGNIAALNAVLADAESLGVDKYLFIGDYASNFPWGNDVVDTIRNLKNAIVIAGNGEGYMENFKNQDKIDYEHEKSKPILWAYRTLSEENIDYLINLPKTATVKDGDTNIYLYHAMGLFYRSPRIEIFHSLPFLKMMTEKPFSHDEYLSRARAALLSCPDAVSDMLKMPSGVYLFGHNHMQFYIKHNDKLFINPGSCGEPLDWDTRASYAILTCVKNDWHVTERKVEFDIHAVAKELDNSEFTTYAPMWSNIMKQGLLSGKDYFGPFVHHLYKTAQNQGITHGEPDNAIWDIAVKSWNMDKI
ncbi:MAG: metallophosphatase family protein [Defluviitaleaceae bacterium]|nr:metallophosphatase family protein [Defluviitaleaceae bacterium]